ncbi:MAG: signal peptidase II [Nanoarchaeota archaeon]|nr:signal peptidase II [Nanoarchaeota archaeon]
MANTLLVKIGRACSSALGRHFFLIALMVLFLDRITKVLVERNMFLSQTIPLIRTVFHFTFVQNTGAGFGLLRGQQSLLILVSLAVVVIIIYSLPAILKDKKTLLPFALLFGGAVGNLIDRVYFGYVIDFIDFRIWPVFNVADTAITIGALWLVVHYWREDRR